MIHRDLQERNILVERIKWGSYDHQPSFWPEDIAPWGYVCNPVHPQKYKFPLPIVELMKIAVYRCLTDKGIEPREYVIEDVCQKQIRNKLRARSLKTLDEAYERFYRLFLFKSEPEEEVKHVPEETLEHEDYEETTEEGEETQEETFEYSDDDDVMSNDDDDDDTEDNSTEDDRAAAISNILNILAND